MHYLYINQNFGIQSIDNVIAYVIIDEELMKRMIAISEFLKNIRTTQNMSQEALARKLNVSFATINRWETGKNLPSKMAQRNIEKFCRDNNIKYEINNCEGVNSDEHQ